MAKKLKQKMMFSVGEVACRTVPEHPSAIVMLVSGGIDSIATALWARQQYPNAHIYIFHNHLEGMDWPQTDTVITALADHIGNCSVIAVQAVYSLTGEQTPAGCNATRLRRLHVVRHNSKWFGPAVTQDESEMLTLLDFGLRARLGQPPTKKIRWCTSYQKQSPTNRWLQQNQHVLGSTALLLSGERAAESFSRSELVQTEMRFEAKTGWNILWHRPVLDKKWHEVVRMVVEANASLIHPGYFIQGETLTTMLDPDRCERGRARLSCMRCIFSRQEHIETARQNAPLIMAPADAAIAAFETEGGYRWEQRNAPLRVREITV